MNFKRLAKKAVEAETAAQRKSLFGEVPPADLPKLARAVKEFCYSFWMKEPVKARLSAATLESLYKFSPQKEVNAYSKWIGGIEKITRGDLNSAVEKLDEATGIFTDLGEEHTAAQPQVAKLYALALLGKFTEAVETGKNALETFEKYRDQLAAGKIEKNLANIFSRREFHSQAEKFYLSARRRFVKLRHYEELTMVENGLAITYAALNDFRRAEKIYRRALARARASNWLLMQAEIEAGIGNLALFRGKFGEALKLLELSRRRYETLRMPHQTAIAELEIADIYLELNLNAEALAIYENVAGQFLRLKLPAEEARTRANFGRAAAALNDAKTARKQLKRAARIYISEKNSVGAAFVKLNEAQLELNLGNYQTVLDLTAEAERFIEQTETARHLLTVRWLQAEARRNLGENEKARKTLTEVFAESVKQEQPNTAQAAQISLGKIAASEKDSIRAKKHFRTAIRLIEEMRAPLAAEEFRMAFLANKLAPFEHLTKIYLAENKLRAAFTTIEKARSRSLADSLNSETQAISRTGNKNSVRLFKELERQREKLNWFYSRLQRAGDSEIETLQKEAKKLEQQIADSMRQIASTDEAKSGAGIFLKFAELQKRLGRRKALLEFVNFDGVIAAFVVTDKKIHFVETPARETEILALLENLHFQFGSLRYGAENLRAFLPQLKTRALFYLQNLYEKLLAPLEESFENRDLTIVPVGALHYVPFHALFNGSRYLIETREVVYAPSATVWQFLASKPQRKLKNALLIGYADERIPMVEREIEILQSILPKAEIRTRETATFAAFTKEAARFDAIHLACHGQFRPENPLFSSLRMADGLITVKDVCSQKLKAEIVTLSACETGLNKIHAGDEILGLARGFLSAGAKSLVLSLWTVNDAATTELMKTFYTELQAGKSTAAALRLAQCRFIESGIHPYFWSPFALIGK